MKSVNRRAAGLNANRQHGAALYVALIMLVLLALIGIVGMQVATLQERMSANYLASNMAFQRAELVVRNGEIDVINNLANQAENCSVSFDPQVWADSVDATSASAVRIRNISACSGKCSVKGGSDSTEIPCNWFRITGFSRDRATAATSSSLAAIDTTFIKP